MNPAPAPVRIGIVGTYATGKTTLMRRIEMELRALGTPALRVGGLGKRAAFLGLPKMARHTALSSEWITTAGAAEELATTVRANVVLADCAAPAALAYYTAALEHRGEKLPPETGHRLRSLVTALSTPYDLLLATVLDPAEPLTGTHDHDPAFRRLVDEHTHQLLGELNLGHVLVANDDTSRADAIRLALTVSGAA
ncbi:AAA family ATPase [Streptomyces sp. ISL-100]|uniref:AAA family ATPase n=1 Tax=Streptomyces sp. ISL-100 TaxID=2819173 RepID=UPI002035C3C0|nr:AAA family ATPase [Streptomyces sp. ISL-100]